jgi:hypothetical protein
MGAIIHYIVRDRAFVGNDEKKPQAVAGAAAKLGGKAYR